MVSSGNLLWISVVLFFLGVLANIRYTSPAGTEKSRIDWIGQWGALVALLSGGLAIILILKAVESVLDHPH